MHDESKPEKETHVPRSRTQSKQFVDKMKAPKIHDKEKVYISKE